MNHQLLDAVDVQDVYNSSLSNTTTVVLEEKNHERRHLNVKRFKGLKKYHQFQFIRRGVLHCRNKSNEGTVEIQEINEEDEGCVEV